MPQDLVVDTSAVVTTVVALVADIIGVEHYKLDYYGLYYPSAVWGDWEIMQIWYKNPKRLPASPQCSGPTVYQYQTAETKQLIVDHTF